MKQKQLSAWDYLRQNFGLIRWLSRMNWIEKQLEQIPKNLHYLDQQIINCGKAGAITLRDLNSGVFVSGTTGAGKSSTTMRLLALGLLKLGCGGFVGVVKNDVLQEWKEFVKETGREDDIVIISEGSNNKYNFLNSIMSEEGTTLSKIAKATDILMLILKMGESSGGDSNSDKYWDNALRELVYNAISLLVNSGTTLSVPNIYKIINDAPTSLEQVTDEKWHKGSLCFQCLQKIEEQELNKEQEEEYDNLLEYFLKQLAALDSKTRGIIYSSFTSLATSFLRGPLKDLFSAETTITPEAIFNGKIILIDLPVKKYGNVGIFAQGIFKYMFQQAAEKRKVLEETKNCFVLIDEFQWLVNEHDIMFQQTARSSMVANIYCTQTISTLHAKFGNHSKAKADALLANLAVKFFHSNNDPVTNKWASELIGKTWNTRANFNHRRGSGQGASHGEAEALEFQIQEQEFSVLKTGSPINDYTVEAVISIAGKVWSNGKNFIKIAFKQKHK